MNNDFYTDRLTGAIAAILEAVDAAVQHDDRLADRTPTELLAATVGAASWLADQHAGDDSIPLEADLFFTSAARKLARGGRRPVAVMLGRIALALIEPGETETSPRT